MNTGRLRRRAKTHHGKSNRHRWLVAYDAARIIGDYTNGATQDMAKDLRLSIATLSRYAMAWVFYRYMTRALHESCISARPLRNARHDLTLKHFYVLGRYAIDNDLELLDCVQALIIASENGVTTEEMMVHIYGEDGKPAPPQKWAATIRQAKGKYGQKGYILTIYIDELFDDSPSYGTPVTLTEARPVPEAEAEAEAEAYPKGRGMQ